jgi:hypothetical protein
MRPIEALRSWTPLPRPLAIIPHTSLSPSRCHKFPHLRPLWAIPHPPSHLLRNSRLLHRLPRLFVTPPTLRRSHLHTYPLGRDRRGYSGSRPRLQTSLLARRPRTYLAQPPQPRLSHGRKNHRRCSRLRPNLRRTDQTLYRPSSSVAAKTYSSVLCAM